MQIVYLLPNLQFSLNTYTQHEEKEKVRQNHSEHTASFFLSPPVFLIFTAISERTAGEEVMSVRALFCPSVVGLVL